MVKDLTLELMEEFPVWTWDETNEFLCPLENYYPLPDDEPNLFIKANFITPNKISFDGYLIGDDCFFAFALFYQGREFVFNLNLLDMIKDNLEKMYNKEMDLSFLFPLIYSSRLSFEGENPINGVFRPDV